MAPGPSRWLDPARSMSPQCSKKLVVYYESMKRKLKTKPIYECRCNGRLKLRDLRSSHTLGWSWNWNT
jgi:hypothetical protein